MRVTGLGTVAALALQLLLPALHVHAHAAEPHCSCGGSHAPAPPSIEREHDCAVCDVLASKCKDVAPSQAPMSMRTAVTLRSVEHLSAFPRSPDLTCASARAPPAER